MQDGFYIVIRRADNWAGYKGSIGGFYTGSEIFTCGSRNERQPEYSTGDSPIWVMSCTRRCPCDHAKLDFVPAKFVPSHLLINLSSSQLRTMRKNYFVAIQERV